MSINPNSDYHKVFNNFDTTNEKIYPNFILSAKYQDFRQINSLSVNFKYPISIISGTNKSGKSTILMSLACSHYNFFKRSTSNGKIERKTWSHILKFTTQDNSNKDWTYFLEIKSGSKIENKRGQRKHSTKKWNGLGKKETQIKNCSAIYIDTDRISPARSSPAPLHRKSISSSTQQKISNNNSTFIEDCISYVFEDGYKINKIASHLDKDVISFETSSKYSSYHSASGEDSVIRILIDSIEAPDKSLILIDEIELGLHPKIQRRLMDAIFHISHKGNKQFIITSHSSTILSCVPNDARIFIENKNNNYKAITPISINLALTKMDSRNHPLLDLFCEDDIAEKIITKCIESYENKNPSSEATKLINVIISGTADKTYQNFKSRERIFNEVKIRSGHSCLLDGDMRSKKDKNGSNLYPPEFSLDFLFGTEPPEKYLCSLFEANNQNSQFKYHINNSNVHSLLNHLIQSYSGYSNKDSAFDACWNLMTTQRTTEINNIELFIERQIDFYSTNL